MKQFCCAFVLIVFVLSSKEDLIVHAKIVCESALTLKGEDHFEWKTKEETAMIKNNCQSWNENFNDTEAGLSLQYRIICLSGCTPPQYKPIPPREITYKSTDGSNLCFRWKEDNSTTYTMFYVAPASVSFKDIENYRRCESKRQIDMETVECCPSSLFPTGLIGVRIDYENLHRKVYGIKYLLRAEHIAIPNSLTNFKYEEETSTFLFREPRDWNQFMFGRLNKRLCKISPRLSENDCHLILHKKTFVWGEELIKGETYNFSAECYSIEGRWSKPKYVSFSIPDNTTIESAQPSSSIPDDVSNTPRYTSFKMSDDNTTEAIQPSSSSSDDVSTSTPQYVSLNSMPDDTTTKVVLPNTSTPSDILTKFRSIYRSNKGCIVFKLKEREDKKKYKLFVSNTPEIMKRKRYRKCKNRKGFVHCCLEDSFTITHIQLRIDYEDPFMKTYGINMLIDKKDN